MSGSLQSGFSRANLLLAVVSPLVFFALFEITLLLLGVDPSRSSEDPFVGFSSYAPLFVDATGPEGETLLKTAPSRRAFFNMQSFPRNKPDNTYRIFCLGGSTTYGRPYDDRTSFAGWLREILPLADPSRDWEVINAGGISYASYRVARLIEELRTYDADLFVIYTGHNEFLEERTYKDLRDTPRPVQLAVSLLARTRVWTTLSKGIDTVLARKPASGQSRYLLSDQVTAKLDHSAGLDLYRRDDPLAEGVVEHFRISLDRMIDLAGERDAKVILVTPASNLKDFSPFKAQVTDGIGELALSQSETAELEAANSIERAQFEEALAVTDQALATDPRNADLHFLRGQALLRLGRTEPAEAAFTRARDEDVCPLRAVSPLQAEVHALANSRHVDLVDYVEIVANATEELTGHRIAGAEYFLDHVHPTVEGNKLLALGILEELIRSGIVQQSPDWGPAQVERVAASIEARVDTELQARGLANLSLTLNWAGKNALSRSLAFQALELGSQDPTLLMMVARHLALEGESQRAQEYFRQAVRANPINAVVHSQFGLFLFGLGEIEAATSHFYLASALWPENPVTHSQLGMALSRLGRDDLALASHQRAWELDPGNSSSAVRVQELRRSLGADRASEIDRTNAISLYPSRMPRVLYQAIRVQGQEVVPDGVWTEWYESGSPSSFALYRGGRLAGMKTDWPAPDPSPDDEAEGR